jgi:parvulin-like peptidyl-prolyl isomerase
MRFIGHVATAALLLLSANSARAQLLQGTKEEVAARVNGESIKLADVQAILEQRPPMVKLTAEQERAQRRAATEMLVDDTLMRQYLRRTVQMPHTQDVDRVVAELSDVLRKQNKTLDQFLRDEKQTEAQLRGDIVTDLQWKAFLNARFNDNEARAYFEANRPFFEKVQVQASHILIKVPPTTPMAEREKVKAQLEGLRGAILNKQLTFEEAARKYSDCPSKERGGDLGRFPFKFVVLEPFARAAFSTQVGDISHVVTTDFGLHLIKVTYRSPAEPADYDAMRDIVRKTMAQESDLFRGILQEQRRTAKIEMLVQ